jgi:hypothetical protein
MLESVQLDEALPFTTTCMDLSGSGASRVEQHWRTMLEAEDMQSSEDAMVTSPPLVVSVYCATPRRERLSQVIAAHTDYNSINNSIHFHDTL